MDSQVSRLLLLRHSTRYARAAGAAAVVIGSLVLLGWLLDVSLLKSVLPGKIAMKPNTAICFVLIGASLLLLVLAPAQHVVSATRMRAAVVCATLVAATGLATLCEYRFGVDLGIDRLFFRDSLLVKADPGRMAANTALGFVQLGGSLLLLDARHKIGRLCSELLALATVVLGAIALLGYLYGIESLHTLFAYTPIAVHTAFLLVLLGLGVLLSHPESGLTSVITSERSGGVMARRIMPVAVFLLIALTWMRSKGGLALFVASSITVLVVWVWLIARSLNSLDARKEQALEALRSSQAQFAGVIGSAMDGIITIDGDQRVVLFNEAAEKMFRCPAASAIGQPLDRFIPPRFRPHHSTDVREFGETGVTTRTMAAARAVSGLRTDGEEFPAEASISQIEVGGQKLFTVIMRDITEKGRALEALLVSELRYRRLFESAKDGILILDAVSGQIVDVNPFLIEVLGYSKEDLMGKELWEMGFFKDVIDSKAAFVELQEKGYIRYDDLPLKTRAGRVRQVEFVSNSYLVNGSRVIQCNIRDITDRKQAEEKARESEARYHSLFENMLEGFAYCQMVFENGQPQDFIYLDVNSAFEKLTGLKNVVGKKVSEVVPGIRESSPELFEIYGRVALTGKPERFEIYIEGLGIWFSIAGYGAEQGNFVAVFDNISERKQAEAALEETNHRLETTLNQLSATTEQLWQASKLATMGELSASIAHELNNPLATVALRAETLLMQLPEDDQKRRSLEVITQEVDRMAALVSDLLQFSRRSHRQISTVDLREEIANSVEFVQYHLRTRKIEVVRGFADQLPTIQADRQQLRQLFLNLLTNASDAMPEGGKLTVRAASSVLDNAEVVAIEFADTGEGIPAENLEKIWDPFFTTKSEGKGTGLGLAICRRICEEHGGTIDIESQVGAGTTVRSVFPATANGAAANLL